MIRLDHVSKIYHMGEEKVMALDDVSLSIQDGEFVSIIGPSGSGKSTMMNIIGCLDTADEGSYILDDQPIETYSERQLARIRNRKIGFIFQNFNLLPRLTDEENVELPLIYQHVPAGERRERVEEALAQVGLSHRRKHHPSEMSGGQQQRVAIARALVTHPSLFLADAVGESLEIDGLPYEVVGVLSQDSTTPGSQMSINSSDGSSDSDDSSSDSDESSSVTLEAFIPFSTMSRIANNVLDIDQFYVSASDEDSIDAAEIAVQQILLKRFDNDEDAFSLTTQSEILEAQASVSSTMSLMLGGIAAISLLVGGIGIMNIMLVSVTERTREIGIRKAIGASEGSILLQFLMEALMVSLAGCAAGIGIAEVLLVLINHFQSRMVLVMNPKVALAAVLFSAVIGIVFGLYPARKAAKMKPIDALRYA